MPRMDTEEYRQFMIEGTRTAMLATVRRDGRPHVAPVWFVMDGEDTVFMTGRDTVKGHAIRREGRAAYQDCADIPDKSLKWSTRIAARYVGEDQAGEFGRRNAVPGELLVRLTPEKIVSEDDMIV